MAKARHLYTYVDESGDLGFSAKASKFFVVAYLTLENPFKLAKTMKRMLKRLHEKREYARGYNELKYSYSKSAIKQKILQEISQTNIEIGFIVLEKSKVKPDLRKNRTILYNYVVVDPIMRNILPTLSATSKLILTIDKSLPRSSIEAFNTYAKNKASWLTTQAPWTNQSLTIIRQISVQHENSQKEPCLQAADFLAGACFHKYEHNNNAYYKIIENKVKYFNYLWRR